MYDIASLMFFCYASIMWMSTKQAATYFNKNIVTIRRWCAGEGCPPQNFTCRRKGKKSFEVWVDDNPKGSTCSDNISIELLRTVQTIVSNIMPCINSINLKLQHLEKEIQEIKQHLSKKEP